MANKSFLAANELDFDTLKTNFKTYLQGQEQFADYDFNGSNLSALLDVLTYNTHVNALYLNMIGSEMFLDSSVLRDSVVSHSKELNYLPVSKLSSVANVNIIVDTQSNTATDIGSSITIPKNLNISTTVGDNNYIFTTAESIVVTKPTLNTASGSFEFIANNVSIFEGDIVTEVFTANTTGSTPQRYVINNANVDTRSIEVNVQTSNTDTSNSDFTKSESLLGLTSASEVFFLQPAEDFKYEIVFGNGVTGKSIENGNIIKITYRNCNGDEPNRANVFSSATTLTNSNYPLTIVTNSRSQLGSEEETISSIKFNAPRHFATQGRAVTTSDYKSLITGQFPQFQTVSVFGGEDASPARFGKVIVVVKPSEGRNLLTDIEKGQITEFLAPRTPLSIDPLIVDAEFNKLEVTSRVKYNTSVTTQSINDIKSKVITAINTFNTNNLGNFGSTLRYSKLISAIDDADSSIISNETTIRIFRDLVPVVNSVKTITFQFENELLTNDVLYTLPSGHEGIIESTKFTYDIPAGTDQSGAFIVDDGLGGLKIVFDAAGGRQTLNNKAGTVNYTTGEVTLSNFSVTAYEGSAIRIFGRLENKDVISTKNIILEVGSDETDVTVTGISD